MCLYVYVKVLPLTLQQLFECNKSYLHSITVNRKKGRVFLNSQPQAIKQNQNLYFKYPFRTFYKAIHPFLGLTTIEQR